MTGADVLTGRDPRLVHGVRLVEAAGVTDDAWLLLRDGVVAARGTGGGWRAHAGDAEVLDVAGVTATPGFVDLHRHGGGGASHEDGPDAILAVHRTHLAHGTTRGTVSFVSAPVDVLVQRLADAADVVEAEPGLLGTHLEGPFLAHERRGAHDPDVLTDPTPAAVDALLRAARGTLRQVTLDPLREGADEALRRFRAAGVVVAVGHSACDGPRAAAFFEAGASLLTHAFNAMNGIGHRAPGPVVAAADDPRVVLELILDGEHVHPSVAALLLRSAPDRVALVTDAMAAADGDDGAYRLGGLDVDVRGGRATLAGTGALAGSTLTQDAALRVGLAAGVPEGVLVGALTAVPARAFGLRGVGGLAVGDAADVVLLGAGHRVLTVLASGTPVA